MTSPVAEDDCRLTPLQSGFTPGQFDVICARGAEAKCHEGNQKFKEMVNASVESYSSAQSKLYKSLVVTSIIDFFRKNSPGGGFVKEINGKWYEVGDQLAREKVGQALRDQLSSHYKSSTKAKRLRWNETKVKKPSRSEIIAHTVKTNVSITKRMVHLGRQLDCFDRTGSSDEQILEIFTRNNQMMLRAMGSDAQLQEALRSVSV